MSEDITGTGRKYAGIDISGKRTLSKEGAIAEFPGFTEIYDNRFNVALCYTSESEDLLKKRVSDPISEITRVLDIDVVLAGRDFTTHTTLLEGLYEGTDPIERQGIFSRLPGTEITNALGELTGKTVTYKYLLIDKGNLLLTAIEIPDWVLEFRKRLAEEYSGQGIKPLMMDNILHISMARITRLPSEERTEKLKEYRKRMSDLRHEISNDPLVLEVERVNVGSPFNLVPRALKTT